MAITNALTTIDPQRDLLTLDDLLSLTGWGKTKTYGHAQAGTLPFPALRNGKKYYFSRRAYEAWRDGSATPVTGPDTGADDTTF